MKAECGGDGFDSIYKFHFSIVKAVANDGRKKRNKIIKHTYEKQKHIQYIYICMEPSQVIPWEHILEEHVFPVVVKTHTWMSHVLKLVCRASNRIVRRDLRPLHRARTTDAMETSMRA